MYRIGDEKEFLERRAEAKKKRLENGKKRASENMKKKVKVAGHSEE